MIDSKELDKLNKKLEKIGQKLEDASKKVTDDIMISLTIGVNKIRNTIILGMRNTPKTGKHYKRGKKKHVASAPGNYPAVDSGDLLKSIVYDVREKKLEVEVGSILEIPNYPLFLEEGTEKMKPRPWLGPSVDKHEKEIIDNVGVQVFKEISGAFE